MKNNDTKSKITASVFTLFITGVCVITALITPIETTSMKILGSFISVVAVSAAAWKFPKRFYFLAMIFDICAAALGSALNLYKYAGFYDKLVHYFSGIVLAEAGAIIISYVLKKRNIKDDFAVKLIFSFFFSSACAGFWEIYEFAADNILNSNMQGGNSNTMGDIISGVSGALTYCLILAIVLRRQNNINKK